MRHRPSRRPALCRAATALLVLAALAGCDDKPKQAQGGPPPKPAVTVVTIKAQPVSLTTDLPGRTTA
jgi:membrane fusion protein (multidrug efflux system)